MEVVMRNGRLKATSILPITAAVLFIILVPAGVSKGEVTARYNDAFLEVTEDGRKVLHLKGGYFEMGYQYGVLMSDNLIQSVSGLERYIEGFGVPGWLVNIAKTTLATTFRPFFLEDDLEFIRGIYMGVGKPFKVTMTDLIVLNAAIDIGGLSGEMFGTTGINCSSFAAWGSLTEEGKMFQTRNVDLGIGTGLEKTALVVYHKPDGQVPYANIGWTGLIGVASGMSANGIGIGQIWGTTLDHFIGTPWCLKTRKILAEAESATEAAEIMRDMPFRTYGNNFVFGDGRNLEARAVETTWHYAAVFEDNDPAEDEALYEGECYAIKIEDAVFRADVAMDQTIRSVQTAANGPDGDPRESSSYRNRYKGQGDRIIDFRDRGVLIGQEEAETISREVAMVGSSLQCVVYANSDLEFWCANSVIVGDEVYDACDQEYFYYDYYSYLPNVDLEANGTWFGPFDRMEITLDTSNTGKDAYEDIYVYLQHGDQQYYLPDMTEERVPYEMDKFFEAGEVNEEVVFSNLVGWSLPFGWSTWTVEACEPETGRMIDVGCVPVYVRLLAD